MTAEGNPRRGRHLADVTFQVDVDDGNARRYVAEALEAAFPRARIGGTSSMRRVLVSYTLESSRKADAPTLAQAWALAIADAGGEHPRRRHR
jgi:hypothetical protein